jgi:ABC-type multidrug transport system ATPase subunit
VATASPSPEPRQARSALADAADSAARSVGLLVLRLFIPDLRRAWARDARSDQLVGNLLASAGVGIVVFVGASGAWGGRIATAIVTGQWAPSGAIEVLTRRPPTGYWLVALGGLALAVFSGLVLRGILRAGTPAPTAADSRAVEETAYRQAEAIKRERQRENDLFTRNVRQAFILQSLEWSGIRVFDDGSYRFAPRVNVLLGKNGYGKTLLLRSLAALIQRDPERSELLLPSDRSSQPLWTLAVTRDGDTEHVVRDPIYFKDSVGKIPLLAIPDSRFINRSVKAFAASPTGVEPLAVSGARHFLTQEPYEPVVLELLSHLCLQYVKQRRTTIVTVLEPKGFELPIFRMIEKVVRQLTEDEEFEFDDIRDSGRVGYEILVRTSGSGGEGLPIQMASQGTLSILAIFGLIYNFLETLQTESGSVETRPGIVIIDEVDAHLHPSWQQKILGALTSTFPNVQFIVSAHSPLVVAGCAWGEVSILRRDRQTGRFNIETPPGDFLGATARDLYEKVFETSDADRLYLEYAQKSTMPEDPTREREMERLSKKATRSAAEEERLNQLLRDKQLTERAAEVRQERLRYTQTQAYIEKLKVDVARLQSKVAEQESEFERLKARAEGSGGGGDIVSR